MNAGGVDGARATTAATTEGGGAASAAGGAEAGFADVLRAAEAVAERRASDGAGEAGREGESEIGAGDEVVREWERERERDEDRERDGAGIDVAAWVTRPADAVWEPDAAWDYAASDAVTEDVVAGRGFAPDVGVGTPTEADARGASYAAPNAKPLAEANVKAGADVAPSAKGATAAVGREAARPGFDGRVAFGDRTAIVTEDGGEREPSAVGVVTRAAIDAAVGDATREVADEVVPDDAAADDIVAPGAGEAATTRRTTSSGAVRAPSTEVHAAIAGANVPEPARANGTARSHLAGGARATAAASDDGGGDRTRSGPGAGGDVATAGAASPTGARAGSLGLGADDISSRAGAAGEGGAYGGVETTETAVASAANGPAGARAARADVPRREALADRDVDPVAPPSATEVDDGLAEPEGARTPSAGAPLRSADDPALAAGAPGEPDARVAAHAGPERAIDLGAVRVSHAHGHAHAADARTRASVLDAAREASDAFALRRGASATVDLGDAGHLAVRATREADRLHVSLRAEHEATARVLAAHRDELAGTLEPRAEVAVGALPRPTDTGADTPGRDGSSSRAFQELADREGGGGARGDARDRGALPRVGSAAVASVGAPTDRQPIVAGKRVRIVL